MPSFRKEDICYPEHFRYLSGHHSNVSVGLGISSALYRENLPVRVTLSRFSLSDVEKYIRKYDRENMKLYRVFSCRRCITGGRVKQILIL
jgi:hypothetical protein